VAALLRFLQGTKHGERALRVALLQVCASQQDGSVRVEDAVGMAICEVVEQGVGVGPACGL